ncbi:leucine-rich repeat domain-containing protein [Tenacibaculum agarivorans]|uniref:leucine-rich repeat domain-containing protein n=1 Tax=Tenacibaculum agarivorans TaxID=1908389 RepID=UPI0013566E56|nr:leucine-rich repeat domain-containing protein [Tenacibaculum agarivorans]
MKLKLLFLLTLVSILINAQNFTVNNIDYAVLNSSEASVTGGDPDVTGTLDIPETVMNGGNVYTVISVRGFAFLNKTTIKNVVFPSTMLDIGNGAFEGTSLENLTLPDNIRSIGSTSFKVTPIETLHLSKNIKNISAGAFDGASKLKTLIVPEGVEEIGIRAFLNTALETVKLPSTIKTIDIRAFENSPQIRSFSIDVATPVGINFNVFSGLDRSLATLQVPTGAVSAYQSASVWSGFGTIETIPVNNAPSFTLRSSPNQTVIEDAGALTLGNYVFGIDDGDSDMIQELTFNVSNNNNALFSVQPNIDVATRSLSFTTAPNLNGIATVTISLSDNGGTANGGVDTSGEQTFTITVTQDRDIFWTGNTNTDWNEVTNWENNTRPNVINEVIIPSRVNMPVIGTRVQNIKDLNIEDSASLDVSASGGVIVVEGNFDNKGSVTISSSSDNTGIFIVRGTSSGIITYERGGLVANEWSIISAPVEGQSIKEFVENPANDIRINTTVTPNRYAVAYYDDSQPTGSKWVYYTTDDLVTNNLTFEKGRGYSISRNTNGSVLFTGTLETENVTKSVEPSQWNAIGNPYTATLASNFSSDNFVNDNLTNFDPSFQALYFWDNTQGKYIPSLPTTFSTSILTVGQGFFVRSASTTTSFSFLKERRRASGFGTFLRGNNTKHIKLLATSNKNTVKTEVNFNNNSTLGLDPGYDAGNFDGAEFDVFTRLADSSSDINFTIQSLPDSDYENLVIPVGVKAKAGVEVSFTIESLGLSEDLNVYLEDRIEGTFTKLDKTSSYTIKFPEVIDGVGRLYLHTKSNVESVIPEQTIDDIIVYNSNTEVFVEGVQNEDFGIKVYNALGKMIHSGIHKGNGKNRISLSQVVTGIYMIELETKAGTIHKKIIIKK